VDCMTDCVKNCKLVAPKVIVNSQKYVYLSFS
jgi:hypothetical protein